MKAVKLGYKWSVGNGRSVKFWEDIWFGNSPLATQFWDLYCIANDKNKTIVDTWDGETLKISFRRNFDDELMQQWLDLDSIARSIIFTDTEDSLIWQFESKGIYSSKSLYAVINFRGVQPIYTPAVWDLKVPPRIQGFLWLFSQNKIMTCDNLRKRGIRKPLECIHCKEMESVHHLFFECVVARVVWKEFEVI